MKCLTCIHYDVVNLECQRLAEKFNLEEPVKVDMDWSCAEYTDASDLKIDIRITI